MGIRWNEEKSRKLMSERGISLDVFAGLILDGKYSAVLENPSRPSQMIFVLEYEGYTYVVPFIIDGKATSY